ncbi:uncharacterized protein LOC141651122 [Silene latifolia]|uniref:uncharacterized protein LOC141651122 n=1 Tax=Silene latifolia TaxID=37657 RepID=UPI003D76D83B
MGWLIARNVMLLKDKLFALHIAEDDTCLLCWNASETHEHLFHSCEYSRQVYGELARRCGISLPVGNALLWLGSCQVSKLKKGVLLCAFMAAQYHLWMQRNKARIEGCLIRPEILGSLIFQEIKLWVHTRLSSAIIISGKNWLASLQLLV